MEPKTKIIEVERAQTLSDWTREDDEILSTLKDHPGFVALCKKLKIQKALLDTALRATKFESLAEVSRYQSGIYWIGYLEKTIRQEVERKKAATPRDPFEVEQKELDRISHALEIIGQ